MKYFIVKYALTQGIFEEDLEEKEGDYLLNKRCDAYKKERDAFLSEEEAKKAAEKMREKKIILLKKQIKKLELLKWIKK